MVEFNPMQRNPSAPQSPGWNCEAWESLLPEALDGTLSAEKFAAFEQHGQGCAACAQMLREARQGGAWLSLLEDQPEPPPELLDKILSRTSGMEPAKFRAQSRVAALPIARQVLEPRFLRTAAMAFFSLALTLNLMGIKLSEARLADFQPATLRTHLTRQYYSANAQVVRYYENLRFVYEMEALVRELRQSVEPTPPGTQPSPASRNGGAGRRTFSSSASASLECLWDPRFAFAGNNPENLAAETPVRVERSAA